jgi:hypothetical protein
MKANDIEQAQDEWEQSFTAEAFHSDLVDVAIWQRLANRNLKRILFSMMPLSKYIQPVFPYLDNLVLNTYFSLPVHVLKGQQAHSNASFFRLGSLGRCPVSGSPLPLRIEARFPSALERVKAWRYKISNGLSRFRPPRQTVNWGSEFQSMYDEIAVCPLYNNAVLKAWRNEKCITPENLRHLHTLSKAYTLL